MLKHIEQSLKGVLLPERGGEIYWCWSVSGGFDRYKCLERGDEEGRGAMEKGKREI
jgi:hypothetical protein